MKITRSQCRAALVVSVVVNTFVLATVPIRLSAQEDVLKSASPDVRALRSLREPLQMFGVGPFNGAIEQATSPDSQALQILNEAAGSGASELRAVTPACGIREHTVRSRPRHVETPVGRSAPSLLSPARFRRRQGSFAAWPAKHHHTASDQQEGCQIAR